MVLLRALCTCVGKMQLLRNTYFKVYRKESRVIWSECFCNVYKLNFITNFDMCSKSIYLKIIWAVITIAIRSIAAELICQEY